MIYLLQCEKFLKVGFTAHSFNERLRRIQAGIPLPVRVVATRPGTEDEEKEFHRQHKDCLTGTGGREWYFDTESLRAEALAFLGATKQRIEISLPADLREQGCEQGCEQESVTESGKA